MQVTLVIPWIAPSDQRIIFPHDLKFETPAQQEEWVRNWVNVRTSFPCNFKIAFYPGRYAHEKMSILPVGDPTEYIPDSEVCLPTTHHVPWSLWQHPGMLDGVTWGHVYGAPLT